MTLLAIGIDVRIFQLKCFPCDRMLGRRVMRTISEMTFLTGVVAGKMTVGFSADQRRFGQPGLACQKIGLRKHPMKLSQIGDLAGIVG